MRFYILNIVLALFFQACAGGMPRRVPKGFHEITFHEISMIATGELAQDQSRPGFSQRLYVNKEDQVVCQVGIVRLTETDRRLAESDLKEFINSAFTEYFGRIKGAVAGNQKSIAHRNMSGREYEWSRPKEGAIIRGRTRILLARKRSIAILQAIMYNEGSSGEQAMEPYFDSLRLLPAP